MNNLGSDQCLDSSLHHNTFCSTFTTKELTTAISKLSNSTALGPDLIAHPRLTQLTPSAQHHLLSIFNWSWSSHTFSSCWKPATIISIYKPGKPADSPASYRPISLTSCILRLISPTKVLLGKLGSFRLPLFPCSSKFPVGPRSCWTSQLNGQTRSPKLEQHSLLPMFLAHWH